MAIKRTCDICGKSICMISDFETDSHTQYYSVYKHKGEAREIRVDFCYDCFSKFIKEIEIQSIIY